MSKETWTRDGEQVVIERIGSLVYVAQTEVADPETTGWSQAHTFSSDGAGESALVGAVARLVVPDSMNLGEIADTLRRSLEGAPNQI